MTAMSSITYINENHGQPQPEEYQSKNDDNDEQQHTKTDQIITEEHSIEDQIKQFRQRSSMLSITYLNEYQTQQQQVENQSKNDENNEQKQTRTYKGVPTKPWTL